MTPRVGFIGLGTMGAPMARNLARAGFPLTVFTQTPAKAAALASELGAGVRAAASAEDVGRASDVVVSCLPDSPEVESVHLGERGTVRGAAAGAVVVDCSTIAAGAARSIGARLAERGIAFVDAPVSGGQKGAIEGTLTFFVGGDAAALEKARPALAGDGQAHHAPGAVGRRPAREGDQPDRRRRTRWWPWPRAWPSRRRPAFRWNRSTPR